MPQKIDLEQIFKDFLKEQNLENQKIILMVSGGVDSMVLLEVASNIIPKNLIAVLHLNHNLREESKEDEIFVQNICSKKGVNFYTETFKKVPEKNRENSWRKERKKIAEKVSKEWEAKKILTAHHASDLVETMIFRITKGCGPSGLSPFDTSTKPFWTIPKQALIDYAEENNIAWKEDATNQDTKYERNLIRQNVIPQLQKITPNLESVFIKESQTFSEVQNFIETQLHEKCETELTEKKIKLEKFLNLPPILQKEFLRKVAQKPVSQAELNDSLKWLLNEPSGNSQKMLGDSHLHLKSGHLEWE